MVFNVNVTKTAHCCLQCSLEVYVKKNTPWSGLQVDCVHEHCAKLKVTGVKVECKRFLDIKAAVAMIVCNRSKAR